MDNTKLICRATAEPARTPWTQQGRVRRRGHQKAETSTATSDGSGIGCDGRSNSTATEVPHLTTDSEYAISQLSAVVRRLGVVTRLNTAGDHEMPNPPKDKREFFFFLSGSKNYAKIG
ncbi:hypothetical protein RRG08_054135 [Elysia crispata]|uniref:Uncharacterized protein n=1 Tax=Elysia crispata TaxID=231223 RepID=A0AAE0Y8A8_9GAST|nr:hypothetical protein RRG08_054135 [Elysia crispata]